MRAEIVGFINKRTRPRNKKRKLNGGGTTNLSKPPPHPQEPSRVFTRTPPALTFPPFINEAFLM